MNISTKSWHYRLLDLFSLVPYQTYKQNLCIYMRRLILLVFGLLLTAFELGFYPYGWYLILTHAKAEPTWYLIVGMVGWMVLNIVFGALIVGGIGWCISKAWEFIQEMRPRKPYEYKEPGIISEYYHSLKDWVCLGITFTD